MSCCPKVWQKFRVKKSDGTELKLRIQDLPSDRQDDAVQFYFNFLALEESYHKAAGVSKSKEALEEGRLVFPNLIKAPGFLIHVCCLDDTDEVGDIIGMSALQLTTKDDTNKLTLMKDYVKSKELRNLFHILEVMEDIQDFQKRYNLDRFWSGRGLSVHSQYRGLGIGRELVRVRTMLCESDSTVPISEAWMTSIGSQKASERAGWKVSLSVPFKELEEKTGLSFSEAPEFCKSMYIDVTNSI